jgi:hypothetical protein
VRLQGIQGTTDILGTDQLVSCCRRAILLVSPTHDDPERVIRQWPLQSLGLVPRRAHPHIALLVGGQNHRHRLRMDRLDDERCEEAVDQMRSRLLMQPRWRRDASTEQFLLLLPGGSANDLSTFFEHRFKDSLQLGIARKSSSAKLKVLSSCHSAPGSQIRTSRPRPAFHRTCVRDSACRCSSCERRPTA